jgi:hypothetical protein
MPASKRFLPPEAVKRVQRLELRARHIVEGFLSGAHRSPYFGQSVEFVQHRQYAPGDDVRHVDWKVWARQDRLVIKQYEEDTNLRCSFAHRQFGQHELRPLGDDQVRIRIDIGGLYFVAGAQATRRGGERHYSTIKFAREYRYGPANGT